MKDILSRVAEFHNTTIEEVYDGIMTVIESAGLEMSPELFVELCSAIVMEEMVER